MLQVTSALLLEMLQAHSACERRMDVAGTMDTVGLNPSWELHPLGLEIRGRDAIREFYRRTLSSSLSARRGSVVRGYTYGDRSITVEQLVSVHGDPVGFSGHPSIAVAEFDDQGLV